jgi:hypothetical protein
VRKLVEPFYVEYEEYPPVSAEDLAATSVQFCATEESPQPHRERRDTVGSMGAEVFDYSTSPGFVHW